MPLRGELWEAVGETQSPKSFCSPFPKSVPLLWTQVRGHGVGWEREQPDLVGQERQQGGRSPTGLLSSVLPVLFRNSEMHPIPGWSQVKAGESRCCAAWPYPIQRAPLTSAVQCMVCAIVYSGPGENLLLLSFPAQWT